MRCFNSYHSLFIATSIFFKFSSLRLDGHGLVALVLDCLFGRRHHLKGKETIFEEPYNYNLQLFTRLHI